MAISALALLLLVSPAGGACQVDEPKLLAMDVFEFDQAENGWRQLEGKPECRSKIAKIIHDYRVFHRNKLKSHSLSFVLKWHEGQTLASMDRYQEAIDLFRQSYNDTPGWNAYVDASIAFLSNDRHSLLEARQRLLKTQKPRDVAADEEWPPNIKVVDLLIRCYGKPYGRLADDPCAKSL